jgi:hypothetical protein
MHPQAQTKIKTKPKSMDQLHSKLLQKSRLYAFWHSQKHHRLAHWAIFGLVAVLFTTLIVGQIKPSWLEGLRGRASGNIINVQTGSDPLANGVTLQNATPVSGAPYPASEYRIEWDSNIHRKGNDYTGDNWPITWAANNRVITVVADGTGLDVQLDDFDSNIAWAMAFYNVTGSPDNISGTRFPTNIDTRPGWGTDGIKASGIISVDGTLYLFIRNYIVRGWKKTTVPFV